MTGPRKPVCRFVVEVQVETMGGGRRALRSLPMRHHEAAREAAAHVGMGRHASVSELDGEELDAWRIELAALEARP